MYLSEETPLVFESWGRTSGRRAPSWETIRLGFTPRLGLIVRPGHAIVFPSILAKRGDVCLITVGPSCAGLAHAPAFEVRWRYAPSGRSRFGEREPVLFRSRLADLGGDEPWLSYRFPLDPISDSTGSIVFASARAWRLWRKPAEIALYELAASDESSLDLERARSFRQLRMRNEQANFDAYYQHAVFQPTTDCKPAADASNRAECNTPRSDSGSPAPTSDGNAPAQASSVATAVEYSRARLAEKIRLDPPPFGWLLRKRIETALAADAGHNRPTVRMLSICCGAARIEADMVRRLPPHAIDLTLLDLNRNLLDAACRNLASWGQVKTIVGDVNELDLRGHKYDVVVCVSALHHVVELEHVIREVADALDDNGEFWSIGETLGRNGGLMWPEPYRVANDFFCALDDKYRRNRVTGVVDKSLPDLDYSIGCFEGIRAEAIEPTLLRFLRPVRVAKHNCIVHKLVSLSYSDNYDMARDEDRRLVDAAVDLDATLHVQGQGRFDVELNGVYRRVG